MSKKGKCNQQARLEETDKIYVRLRNKHCAIESNINELEHSGLNRCSNKGQEYFKCYIGLVICAYNLKRIGRKHLEITRAEQELTKQHNLHNI